MTQEYAETTGAYNTYLTYLALKQHFTIDSYDYFKYKGTVNATPDSFKRRRDKKFFLKLSKQRDPDRRILAHLVKDSDVWIGDICDDEKTYQEWAKRYESFTYFFQSDLSRYDDMESALAVYDGQYPAILTDYYNGKVSLETIVGLDIATGIMTKWKSQIQETFVFPSLYKKVNKYKPFFTLNKQKLNQIINPERG